MAVAIGAVFIPGFTGMQAVRLSLCACAVLLALLMLMIYVSEKVYWINGVTFEKAVEAGSERRKAFAKKHLTVFACAAAFFVVISAFLNAFHMHVMIDTAVFTVIEIIAAVRTIKYKL